MSHGKYLLSVRVSQMEADAVLERLDGWFTIDRPDSFFDCDALDTKIWLDDVGRSWACVEFPAADDEMAAFMVSLAAQECGLGGTEFMLVAQ